MKAYDVDAEWVHLEYAEHSAFREVYGFAGAHGTVNLEGIRYVPRGRPSRTLFVFMHPSSTLQLLPVPKALAARGAHVLCAASRYARNDTALIMEKVVLDLGAYIRHAKEKWNYEHVILAGWSGGGSLALMYQAEAEQPTITHTPAGDPVDLIAAKLIPADALVFQAAHVSRAVMLAEMIDPSVRDEDNPDDRDVELDLYDPRNPHQPPYSAEYIARFRQAQLARLRRRTAWVKEQLARLKSRDNGEMERGFVTHRTLADPRFLDLALDPNDRPMGGCYLGNPATVNSGPVGIARFSTLRSWLSQWSVDDTNAHGEKCAARIQTPLLAIENSADDAVPQPHTPRIYAAAKTKDKTFHLIKGATHYYVGQPHLMHEAIDTTLEWLGQRGLYA
jgi:pimeloyl-ACP methyl ester carboxylesterase